MVANNIAEAKIVWYTLLLLRFKINLDKMLATNVAVLRGTWGI